MNTLQKQIERCFGSERVPNIDQLVEKNGFDDLDKAEAVKNFGGKSWETVYQYLLEGKLSWTNVRLEEWSCLAPDALRYYIRPYLLYLVDTLKDTNPNDEFISYLFSELQNVLRTHGRGLFNERQRALLIQIASMVLATVEDAKFEIWREGIEEHVDKCLAMLNTSDAG